MANDDGVDDRMLRYRKLATHSGIKLMSVVLSMTDVGEHVIVVVCGYVNKGRPLLQFRREQFST